MPSFVQQMYQRGAILLPLSHLCSNSSLKYFSFLANCGRLPYWSLVCLHLSCSQLFRMNRKRVHGENDSTLSYIVVKLGCLPIWHTSNFFFVFSNKDFSNNSQCSKSRKKVHFLFNQIIYNCSQFILLIFPIFWVLWVCI